MTRVQELAQWVTAAEWKHLSNEAREALKLRILDALGCAAGALGSDVMAKVRGEVEEMGGNPRATLVEGRPRDRPADERQALQCRVPLAVGAGGGG